MFLWINGPFGGGKTTLARRLHAQLDQAVVFDPEEVGFLLRDVFRGREKDFQDLAPWRPLVVETGARIHEYNQGHPVISPMSLLLQPYGQEILGGLAKAGVPVTHLLLHVDPQALAARIDASAEFPDDEARSEKVRNFRRRKAQSYQDAYHQWLRDAAQVIDTTQLTPDQVLDRTLEILEASW